jgi:Raf kinase inhibitor-like YbhB/YbcL family protein
VRTQTSIVLRAALLAAALGAALLAAGGCGGEESAAVPSELAPPGKDVAVFSLTSTAFDDGAEIPTRHTCDGADLSPPLTWGNLPEGTESLALLVDDPDAPGGTFTHWVAWDIDPAAGGLGEGMEAPGEGANGAGSIGYGGPCPPGGDGAHHYLFRVYALDSPLPIAQGADKAALQDALKGHVLGVGELTGTYARS